MQFYGPTTNDTKKFSHAWEKKVTNYRKRGDANFQVKILGIQMTFPNDEFVWSGNGTELLCVSLFYPPSHYCFPISGRCCCATRLNFASSLVRSVVSCDLCQVFAAGKMVERGFSMHKKSFAGTATSIWLAKHKQRFVYLYTLQYGLKNVSQFW